MQTLRNNRHTALALSIALLLTLAACGGSDDASSTSPAAPTATESATATPSETAASTAAITIASFAFSGVSEVPVGTTVTVSNDDSTSHTWTSLDGAFDSTTLAPGASFQFTFDTAGTFAYRCNIHPSMTGSITVTG